MIRKNIDVSHLKAGDYVVAVFDELEPDKYDNYGRLVGGGDPNGRTYQISGVLYKPATMNGLHVKEGFAVQCVRQSGGEPGGWLRRIVEHIPGGE